MNSCVSCTRNHRFCLSSFASEALEHGAQVLLILETLVTKLVTSAPQEASTNQQKNDYDKNTKHVSTWTTFFWYFGSCFHLFSDLYPTWPPEPQNGRQMSSTLPKRVCSEWFGAPQFWTLGVSLKPKCCCPWHLVTLAFTQPTPHSTSNLATLLHCFS